MLIYNDVSKVYHVVFKNIFTFLVVFKLHSISAKFQVNHNSSLSTKKHGGGNFTPTPRQWLRGQNTSVGMRLIGLTEPSDILNYKPFFKHCILQTVLHLLVWNKIFYSKTWAVFYIFFIWFGVAFSVTIFKVLCFWCSLYKIIGNQIFFSYSGYNLLGIAIKVVL